MEHHTELESLGILRQTKLPASLNWMTDSDKDLLTQLHLAGEEGLHKSFIAKFEKKNPETLLRLTVRDLAEWQSDKLGKPVCVVQTWKGEEVGKLLLQVAKHESQAAARAAANSGPAAEAAS